MHLKTNFNTFIKKCSLFKALISFNRTKVDSFSSASGQAFIEYILMLVVVLAVFFGLLAQFGTPFRDWAKNYFGEYLACVIETGELPSLGGPNGVNRGECSEQFQPFTLAGGRPPAANSGANSSDGSSGDNDGANRTKKRIAAGSGSRQGSTFGRGSNRFQGGGSGLAFDSSDSDGKNDKSYTGSTDSSLPGWAGGRKKRIEIRSAQKFKDGYSIGTVRRKDEDKKIVLKTKTKSKKNVTKKRRLIVERRLTSKSAQVDEDVSFTFGNFIKYILIIGIIIFLVFFLASELFNINKSME